MGVALASRDLAAIRAVQQAMVSPLDHGHVDQWRRTVARAVKPLLGADKVTVVLPVEGRYAPFSEDACVEDMARFPAVALPLDRRWSMWQRVTSLGVWSGRTVWGPWYAEYLRTPYHNEFLVPNRYLDSIGIACVAGSHGTVASPDTTAGIWMHHASLRGPRFGTRGRAMLEHLLPAWTAGIEVHRRLDQHRASFARLVDGLGVAMLVATEYGRVLHRTPTLDARLGEDPQSPRLLTEMAQMAGALAWQRRSPGVLPTAAFVREVQTSLAAYRLRASTASPELLGSGPIVMVVLERLTPALPTPELLCDRFGLTRTQAEVAIAMAGGAGYEAIADARGLSVHTVRRHAEQVRARLGARSQVDVAAIVSRAAHATSG